MPGHTVDNTGFQSIFSFSNKIAAVLKCCIVVILSMLEEDLNEFLVDIFIGTRLWVTTLQQCQQTDTIASFGKFRYNFKG